MVQWQNATFPRLRYGFDSRYPLTYMSIDTVLLTTVADWCVNLSAGWFGAAFIVPAFSERSQEFNRRLFLINILFALAYLLFAYILNVYGVA